MYTIGSQSWFSEDASAAKCDVSTVKHWSELSGKDVSHIECGYNFMAALTSAGLIYTWGTGAHGQLGLGEDRREKFVDAPQLIESLPEMTQIACGDEFMAAIDSDGKCWTWGRGESGALGHGDEIDMFAPRYIESMEGHTVVTVRCGALHTAILTDTKDVYTFGSNILGQLGRIVAKTKEIDPSPKPVELIQMGATVSEENLRQADEVEFVTIECLRLNTIALTADGKLFSCGKGGSDGGGNGTNPHTLLCILDSVKDMTFSRIARAGWTHAAAIAEDGSVWIWGNDDHSQLGLEKNAGSKSEPFMLFPKEDDEGARRVYDVCCAEMHTAAIFEPSEDDVFPDLAAKAETVEADVEEYSDNEEEEQEKTDAEIEERLREQQQQREEEEREAKETFEDFDDTKQVDEDSDDDEEEEEEGAKENGDELPKSNDEKSEDKSRSSTESVDGEPRCTGYLLKKGDKGIVKLWRKRWFVLTDTKLTYFEKEGGSRRGAADLNNLLDVLPGHSKNDFNVTTRGRRTYELRASNTADALKWISAINTALADLRTQPS